MLLTCFCVSYRRWSFRVSNPPPALEWRPSDGISQEATPGCVWVFHQAWCEGNRLHFRMKVTVTLSYTRVLISLHFVLPLCLFFTGEILHVPWQVNPPFCKICFKWSQVKWNIRSCHWRISLRCYIVLVLASQTSSAGISSTSRICSAVLWLAKVLKTLIFFKATLPR